MVERASRVQRRPKCEFRDTSRKMARRELSARASNGKNATGDFEAVSKRDNRCEGRSEHDGINLFAVRG